MKRLAALALMLAMTGLVPAPARADQESDIGAQVYQQLQAKGEIIPRPNSLYNYLDPIASRIKRVADPQYTYPFQFILVHEKSPNAFAVPGGNVYVTDSLMKFVQNKEELAGVLCHETSHNIHHDVLNLYKEESTVARNYQIGDIVANVLTGGKYSGVIDQAAGFAFNLQSLRFSRTVEGAADAKGAQTCAQAGWNPWGMVWLFQHFETIDQSNPPEFLSDHPTDQSRIAALENEFQADPSLFGRYPSTISAATAAVLRAPRWAVRVLPLAGALSGVAAEMVETPTGPPSNFSMIVRRTL